MPCGGRSYRCVSLDGWTEFGCRTLSQSLRDKLALFFHFAKFGAVGAVEVGFYAGFEVADGGGIGFVFSF